MKKLIGTYQCVACKTVCDGSELHQDPQSITVRWTCSDLFCGANVKKISDLPKAEGEKTQKK